MKREIDYNETDRLVAELRKRLEAGEELTEESLRGAAAQAPVKQGPSEQAESEAVTPVSPVTEAPKPQRRAKKSALHTKSKQPLSPEPPQESSGDQEEQTAKKAEERQPLTVTQEDDQVAFALPEVDRHPRQPEESFSVIFRDEGEQVDTDESQIGLFSSFSVGKLRRKSGMKLNPTLRKTTEAEKELKRSVESSEDELELLLALGYEDELGRAIGFEKIRDYHELAVNGKLPSAARKRKRGERREYELPGQDISMRKTYAKQKGGYIVSLAIAAIVLFVLFVYEHPLWMATIFHGPLDGAEYPVSYILIGIQLLIVASAFSYRRLAEGFLRLIRFSPIDSSFCSVMVIVTFCYHIVLLFMPHEGYPTLYLSPAAACMVLLVLADLLDWYRESLAFQVVSSRRQKYALVPRISVGGKQNNARERLMESDQDETVWHICPVGFVRNYFANTGKRADHQRTLGAQLLMIVAIGMALGLYVFATGGSAEQTWKTVFVTFLFSVPAMSLLVTSLPMFLASCLRLKKQSAIIGEEIVYRCGEKTSLVFSESDAFDAVQRERFELTDDCDAERVIALVKALLEKVESPLSDAIDVDYDPVELTITDIEERGVAALAGEEKTPLIFGSVDYLQKYGIKVQPKGADLEDICRRLLCVAIDRQVSVLFLARYHLDDEVRNILADLESQKVRVLVRTRDPGVYDDMLARLMPRSKSPVCVMKPAAREVDIRVDRADATIVSLGSAAQAAKTFLVCRAVRRAGNFGKFLQALSIVFGLALSTVLALFGYSASISPLTITVYMLFWCALHGAMSYFQISRRADK